MKKAFSLSVSAASLLLLGVGNAQAQVSFQTLPDVLSCNAMSANSRFIVGDMDFDGDNVPDGQYIYDRQIGSLDLLSPGGNSAVAVSNDGQRVLGSMPGPDPQNPQLDETAAMWTSLAGWQSLGSLPNAGTCPSKSNGYSMTADGSTAVGLSWDGCSGRGFIWTAETGMLELEPMANGGNRASVISPDGSVIAGFAQGTFNRTPTRWDANTLEGTLLGPAGADAEGEVLGISDDNSTLVGRVFLGTGASLHAAKWVNGGKAQMIAQGSLLPGWTGNATDIASNGTIVGFDNLLGNRRAWIKPDDSNHIQLLTDWAIANGADIPAGVELWVAREVSNDGDTIIGFGFNGSNVFGFILEIELQTPPCPADVTGDGNINLADLNLVLANFGQTTSEGDTNSDGEVNLADLNAVLAAFGTDCP